MRKFLMILMAITVMTGCSKVGPENGGDNGGKEPGACPVTEVRMPESAEAGEEILVKGKGFRSGAVLYLMDSSKTRTDLKEVTVTSSGVSLVLPENLETDEYELYLVQDEEWKLGRISIKARESEVTDIDLPASVMVGEKLLVGGIGFNGTSAISLKSGEGKEIVLKIVDRKSGLLCEVPADLAAGSYEVVLKHDGKEKVIGKVKVMRPVVKKQLVSMAMVIGDSKTSTQKTEDIFRMEYDGYRPVRLVYTNVVTVYKDGKVDEASSGKTELVMPAQLAGDIITFTSDGSNGNIDLEFALKLKDGRVVSNDVKRSADRSQSYDWTYDKDGHLETLSGKRPYMTCTWKENSMTGFEGPSGGVFNYTDSNLVNSPYGVDIAQAYLCLSWIMEISNTAAVLMEAMGTASSQLPASMGVAGDLSFKKFTYELDADGYVLKAFLGSTADYLKFEYR